MFDDNDFILDIGLNIDDSRLDNQLDIIRRQLKDEKFKIKVDLDISDAKETIDDWRYGGIRPIVVDVLLDYSENTFKYVRERLDKYFKDLSYEIKIDFDNKHLNKGADSLYKSIKSINEAGDNLDIQDSTITLKETFESLAKTINEIKVALGSVDDNNGIKDLLSTINEVSKSLSNISRQFEELSKKDFSVNFDIKMGGSKNSPIKNNADYGNFVKKTVLPQFEKQLNEYAKISNEYLGKNSNSEFDAIFNLIKSAENKRAIPIGSSEFVLGASNDIAHYKASLTSKLEGYKGVFVEFEKAAEALNIDLSKVNSKFSQSTEDLVQKAYDIKDGVHQANDEFEKLKGLFGGNNTFNIEEADFANINAQLNTLSETLKEINTYIKGFDLDKLDFSKLNFTNLEEQLKGVVESLNKVELAINDLSNTSGVTNLITSFDKLSDTLQQVFSNISLIQTYVNNAHKQSVGNFNSSVNNIGLGATQTQFNNAEEALKKFGFDKSSRDEVLKDIKTMDIAVSNITTKLNNDGSINITVKGLDELGRLVTYIKKAELVSGSPKSETISATISQSFDQEVKQSKEVVDAYKRLLDITKQIGKSNTEFIGLDEETQIKQFQVLERQIIELDKEYTELINKFGKSFKPSQLTNLDNEFKKIANSAEVAEAKVDDLKAKLVSDINMNLDNGKIVSQITSIESKFAKLNNASIDLNADVNMLRKLLSDVVNAKDINDIDALISKYKELGLLLEKTNNQISSSLNDEKMFINFEKLNSDKKSFVLKIDKWLKANSAAARDFGDEIENIRNQITKADNVKLTKLKKEFDEVKDKAVLAGKATLSATDRFKNQFTRLTTYYSASMFITEALMGLRSMYNAVLEVDTAMTELYRVTDLTTGQYNKLYDDMTESAKKYGVALNDIITSTADWVKLGFDSDVANRLAEITTMYQHISDLENDVAVENLVTAYKGFQDELLGLYNNDEAKAIEYIADVYNELGNNYAVTADGVGDAMTRAASALDLAGNTFQESSAMITGISEVTQDYEKSGSALKILSLRLRGMKGQLEELGEETDENVENISKMQGQILNLTHGKVNIFDSNGEFKSTYEIMQGIAEVFDTLNSTEQAELLETIAGKHRANDVAALISNWEQVEKAVISANEAEGSASIENAKYLESLKGKIDSLKAAWQALSNTVLSSDLLKTGVELLTHLINLIDGVISTLGGVGTLSTVVSILAIFKGESLIKNVSDLVKEFFGLDKAAKLSSISLKNVANTFKGFKGYAAGIGLVVTVVSKLITAYKDMQAEQSSRRQETLKTNNEILDSIESVEQAYVKYSEKSQLTSDEEDELKSIIDDTVTALGNKAGAIQDVINKNGDYIKSLDEVAEAEIKEAKMLADENLYAARKELEKESNGLTGSKINVDLGGVYETGVDKEIRKILQEVIPEYVNESDNAYGVVLNFKLAPNDSKNMDSVASYYYALSKAKAKLNELGYVESDIYQDINKQITTLKPKVEEYVKQQYNSLKYEYMMQNGIPKTIKEYEELQSHILKNVDASQEYKDVLSDIINQDFSNILGIDLGKHYAKLEKLNNIKQKYLSSNDFKNDSWFNSQNKSKEFDEWLNTLDDKQIDIVYNIKVDDSELQNWSLNDWKNYLTNYKSSQSIKYSFSDLMKDESFLKTVDTHTEKVNTLKDALDKLKDGSFDIDGEDFVELVKEFPELADNADNLEEALKQSIEDINLGTFEELISYLDYMDSDADYTSLQNFIAALTDAEVEMHNVLDFTDFLDNLNNVVDSFDNLVGAMSKLRDGTALTKGEIVDLISEYPKLLTEANLFTDGSISGQQKMLDNILQVYEAEYNALIDTKIAELKASNEVLNAALENEKAKAQKVIEISALEVEGKVLNESELVRKLQEFNDLEGQNYVEYSNGVLSVNKEMLDDMLVQEGEKKDLAETNVWKPQAVDIAESYASGASDALQSLNTFGTRLGTWAKNTINNTFKPLKKAFSAIFNNEEEITEDAGSSTVDTDIKAGLSIEEDGKATIDGQSIDDWSAKQQDILEQRIKDIQDSLKKNNIAIENLENLKGLDLISLYGGDGSGSGGSDSSSKSSQTFNWIETAIERVQRALSNLDRTANSVYKSWGTRNDALSKQIKKTRKEIDLQNKAAEYYKQKANSIGLDDKWKQKIEKGLVEGNLNEVISDIDTSTDSGKALADKISQYQEWYSKILECEDAVLELKESESDLYKQSFDNVVSEYENRLSIIEHEKSMIDAYISQSEAKGWVVSTKYYENLMQYEEQNIAKLQEERNALLEAMQDGIANGGIEEGSEAWHEMVNQIDSVTLAIEESKTSLIEYGNAIREIEWEVFDMIREQVSYVTDEANFLIDLMSNKKLYNDNGQLTEHGMATMGMHGMNYNVYIEEANAYAKELLEIEKELAENPYDKALIARKQELIELQQESILSAEEEKQAIISLVEEGISLELDALQSIIDKYEEALDSQKD